MVRGRRDTWLGAGVPRHEELLLNRRLAADVGTFAISEALRVATGRFDSVGGVAEKDASGDLVTDVDIALEDLMARVILDAFPSHSIQGEESWARQGENWTWLIDPLDGTNNYALGLPLYGSAVSLCWGREPVMAVLGSRRRRSQLVIAWRGQGVSLDGAPWVAVDNERTVLRAGLWLGYGAGRRSEVPDLLRRILGAYCGRTFEHWAPVIDVVLYLQGDIDLVVGWECQGLELPSALLVLREAGAAVIDEFGNPVDLARIPSLFLACRPSLAGMFQRLLADEVLRLRERDGDALSRPSPLRSAPR